MLKSRVVCGLAIAGLSLVVKIAPASAAQDWYFWVENQSNADITELLVSEDAGNWGHFDLGSGIAAGEKAKLVWAQSTNNQACNQWIKASFSDDTESVPQKFDFCKNLDTPIVFSEE